MNRARGFTLIELMIAVAIIGVMAAVAIPSFIGYVRRSKASEAPTILKSIYVNANSYYTTHRSPVGMATTVGRCTVDATGATIPAAPTGSPQTATFHTDPSFRALGLPTVEHIYYAYGIDSPGSSCGTAASNTIVYTFFAVGDLDGDMATSRFELAIGTDTAAQLYRAVGFYVENELE